MPACVRVRQRGREGGQKQEGAPSLTPALFLAAVSPPFSSSSLAPSTNHGAHSPTPRTALAHAPPPCLPTARVGGGPLSPRPRLPHLFPQKKKKTHAFPATPFQQAVSKRVQNAKVAKFSKNIHKRGLVPAGEVRR